MKKVAVTGYKGQIGRRLVALGAVPLKCNILDRTEITNELRSVNPDIIIHAAGISSIDKCEQDYELALAVNVWGFNNVCELAGDGKVVLLSSEQVFDGVVGNYKEDDEPNPINNYGHSKFGAEAIAQLYGNKIIRLSRGFSNRIGSDIYNYTEELKKGNEISVPYFISRNYCHLDYISEGIMYYAKRITKMPEILHLGGEYSMYFFEFMQLVAERAVKGYDLVRPRQYDSEKEKSYSPRPHKCGLDVSLAKNLFLPIHNVFDSVKLMLTEEPHAN